jgi:hypothetical protein
LEAVMKVQVSIAGTSVLLDIETWEYIVNLLDGCEVMDENYRGKGKGFFGRDLDYDISFGPFLAAHHAQGVRLLTDNAIDKYKTLIEYRKENSNA